MNSSEIIEYIEHLGQREYIFLGLVVFTLALFLVLAKRCQPKKIVAYKTGDGRVHVARTAVKDLVQSACEQLDGVTRPKTRIRIKRGCANFDVEVKLVGNSRLREVESALQKQMRKALTENLGIEKLGAINVTATGFKMGRPEKGQTNLNHKIEEIKAGPEPGKPIPEDLLETQDDKKSF
jgi:hypothetical protein